MSMELDSYPSVSNNVERETEIAMAGLENQRGKKP